MRVLHLIRYEKFTCDYINRINNLFNPKDHLFIVFGNKIYPNIRNVVAENTVYTSDFKSKGLCSFYIVKEIIKSEKVILHALFFSKKYLNLLLILQPFSKSKYFWNIWGYDLYNMYWEREEDVKKEKLRRKFIKNLRAVGYIPGDYVFLKEHYQTEAKFYLASYSYDFFVPEIPQNENDKYTINILLGNSATEECQYDEAIDLLSKYKDHPIKIKCILAYPQENIEYINQVVSHGKAVFGDKFEALTEYMSYEDYTQMLSGIDIAIFNHNRQQALGNIASLLYLGKRVYINSKNACKGYFEDLGAVVYDLNDLSEKDICKNSGNDLMKKNREAIDVFFSDKNFKSRWETIFEDKF